jgi:hypothetical protein
LCGKVLELRADVFTAQIPTTLRQVVPTGLDGEEMVPQEFKKIIEGCLSREHTERPSMRSVIRDLDRLSGKFYYEEKGSIFVPYRASTD